MTKLVLLYKLEIEEEAFKQLKSDIDSNKKQIDELTEKIFSNIETLTKLILNKQKIVELQKKHKRDRTSIDDAKLDVLYAQRKLLEEEHNLFDEEIKEVSRNIIKTMSGTLTLDKVLDHFEIELLEKRMIKEV